MNLLESLANKIASTVQSDSMLKRTVFLLLVLLVVTFGFMEYIRLVWRDNFELRAPGTNGAVVFHSSYDDGFRKVVFLVPASQCWINTELPIEPGETIEFTTSGKVHLALNLIKQEELAIVKWSKPDGSPFTKPTKELGDRRNFLMIQQRNDDSPDPLVGNLVGFLQADGIDEAPGPNNPRPKGDAAKNKVFHIGHAHTITNETGHKAYLWLSVNDIVLTNSEEARLAYLGDSTEFVKKALSGLPVPISAKDSCQQAKAAWQQHVAIWDSICARRQWDLYFNDNIGTYLVFIEKKPRRSFR
jgi:hypothetical protein